MATRSAGALRARAFAEPLLSGQLLDTGEDALAHADGVAAILHDIGAAPSMRAAAYLVYAADYLPGRKRWCARPSAIRYASLVGTPASWCSCSARRATPTWPPKRARSRPSACARCCSPSPRPARGAAAAGVAAADVALVRREQAACPAALARESQQVFAPLANRLGIWQIKWEIEDLAFRFLEPERYREIARQLDETRVERERDVERSRRQLEHAVAPPASSAEVQGRPKHLYSIWKKMQGKALDFAHVFDVRALRVIVADVPACYAVLGHVHERWRAVPGEFDDYIARPKANGYQSLHTVVRDDEGRPVEVQIRTRAMHEHAEHGVAAHWAYKEAGARGYAGVSAAGDFEQRIAQARKAVLRQLLAWERDFVEQGPVDAVRRPHLRLHAAGHDRRADRRCHADRLRVCGAHRPRPSLPRRARRRPDGAAEHAAGERADGRGGGGEGGRARRSTGSTPSSATCAARARRPRCARGSTRIAQGQTIARGRELVEKLLQREGRTALKLDDLASQLGFRNAEALFEVVGKDEFSLRNIEALLRPGRAAARRRADRAAAFTRRHGQGRRAGGRRRVAADHAGALLQAGAAGRDRRLRHARPRRGDPSRRLPQLPRSSPGARPSA